MAGLGRPSRPSPLQSFHVLLKRPRHLLVQNENLSPAILRLKPRQHGVAKLFPHTLSRRRWWTIKLLLFYSAYSIHKHCIMSPLRAERRMASRRSDLLSPWSMIGVSTTPEVKYCEALRRSRLNRSKKGKSACKPSFIPIFLKIVINPGDMKTVQNHR